VPTSHLVPDAEVEKLGDAPFGSEERSNLWPGSYKEQEVAIKVILRYATDDEKAIRRRLCREAVIWKRMSHPNVLPFIGVTLSEELSTVSPWMENGNVLNYLGDNHEANPIKLLEESVLGLQYLHEIGIAHGDIQGQSISVSEEGHALLANFEHASIIGEQDGSELGPASPSFSSRNLRYCPPEDLTSDAASRPATRQGDVYSMGMTIYEVLTDKRPFYEHNPWFVVVQILKGARPKKPSFATTRGFTEELWELTTTCWQPDPMERPTLSDLLRLLGNMAPQWQSKEK